MIKVKIQDVPGYTGEYEWDETKSFTGHELHVIKNVAGVRMGEISEALGAGDYDVIVAVSAIAVWRSGRVTRAEVPFLVDALMDAEGGKIVFGSDEEEDAEDPPAEPTPENENDLPSGGSVSSLRSSSFSRSTGGVLPETTPQATGSPGSVADAG